MCRLQPGKTASWLFSHVTTQRATETAWWGLSMLRSCMTPPSPGPFSLSWRKTDVQLNWKQKLMEQMYESGALVQDRKVEKMGMEIEKGMNGKHPKIWAHSVLQSPRQRKDVIRDKGEEICRHFWRLRNCSHYFWRHWVLTVVLYLVFIHSYPLLKSCQILPMDQMLC